MTLEKIFIVWQCVYLTISMCGWAELTDRQIFFPSVCAVIAFIGRVYVIYRKKKEIQDLHINMMKNLGEIERIMGKRNEEDN